MKLGYIQYQIQNNTILTTGLIGAMTASIVHVIFRNYKNISIAITSKSKA